MSSASEADDRVPRAARAVPATEKAARQVEAILQATLRTIAAHGYAATSLARIAAEAGTTKRMVLYYFESREQLFSELVHRITARMVAESRVDVAAADDVSGAMRSSLRHVWEHVTGDPDLVRAYFAVLGEAGADPQLRALLEHVREAHLDSLADDLERARAEGIEIPVDPDTLSVLMFAGFRGLLLEFYEHGETPALRQALGLFEDTVAAAFAMRPA
ncbi:MAG: helix-turn-helix domain containing protein [Patulibacter minatonensis]